MRVPIICFEKSGGMPEFVEADAGIVVPYLDVEAMALAVSTLMKHPQEREKLGNRAKAKVITRHDVAIGAGQIASIISELLSRDLSDKN